MTEQRKKKQSTYNIVTNTMSCIGCSCTGKKCTLGEYAERLKQRKLSDLQTERIREAQDELDNLPNSMNSRFTPRKRLEIQIRRRELTKIVNGEEEGGD